MNLNNRTNLFVMSLLLLLLIMSYLTTIYASITTNSNWILILSNPGHDSSEYGDVYYYYEVYKFSGYTQGGYREWYTVYLRTTDDPVNPQSDDEGFTVAGKAGESSTGGGVGPYIYDKYYNFDYGVVNEIPSSSQTSCAGSHSESFGVSASVSKDGPSVTASYSQSTTWNANGVAWSLTDVYPKTHWEFWECNEPPSSSDLGAAWTFETTVTYIKTYNDYPGIHTYSIELGPAAGFRHWYKSCYLWIIGCHYDSDYSVHWNIPVSIRFNNS